MKFQALLALCLVATPVYAMAQKKVPNLGDKVCVIWTGVSEKAKVEPGWEQSVVEMDWWSMGYLKGISAQYTSMSKQPNPLLKSRNGEELAWMQAFCRINSKLSISDAAEAFLEELKSRP